MQKNSLIIAVPKGRIYLELKPILDKLGVEPEPAFFDEHSRQLQFKTNQADIEFIRVRSFDVPTFVAFGAADIGIAGSDVLQEFHYPDLYAPVDLNIGHCRLSVAEPASLAENDDPSRWSHIRVANKYPHLTKEHFAKRGVQAECIKLHGAMELAPSLGLSERIVDLVSSGATLKANGLVEVEKIMDISSRLIVNRTAYKTRGERMHYLIEEFRKAVA